MNDWLFTLRFEPAVLGALCAWRLTHLLHAEDGPARAVARMRHAAGAGIWGQALDCFYCLSLWCAAPLALLIGAGWLERALLWPALSGAACLLERVTTRAPYPGTIFEHPQGD